MNPEETLTVMNASRKFGWLDVGYNDATGRLLFRNSWGGGWGKKGYGELPYDYLTRRDLSDDFWCVQATANDIYASIAPQVAPRQ